MRKTFADRTFSKMEPGSLRGSIFSLCSAAIGAGVLSLPYVLVLNGWVIGICFIIIGALAADWSNCMLAQRAIEYKVPNYQKLCEKAGGPKLAQFLSICILIYIFGVLISYQIIMTSLFKYAIHQFGVSKETSESERMSVYESVPFMVFFLFPLCMKRDQSAFRYISMFSIVALFYTAVVLIIELPAYYKHFSSLPGAVIPAYYIDLNLFSGCAMTFYSYQC